MLFKSKQRVDWGNNYIFEKLISEINFLENTGIKIGSFVIKFVLMGITGDNLGLHTILGFNESFNTNYSCRFCKIDKKNSYISINDNIENRRTPNNYEEDLARNDPASTGIKTNCVFNKIKSFHCTENFCVDVMHDIFEGVAKDVLCRSIIYFIENKYFTIDLLNLRILNFPFNKISKSNKPPKLNLNKILKGDLLLNASETKLLITYIPLIIGDFIPKNCEV